MVELRADMRRVWETGRGGYGEQSNGGMGNQTRRVWGFYFNPWGLGDPTHCRVTSRGFQVTANQAIDRFLGKAAGNSPVFVRPPDPSFYPLSIVLVLLSRRRCPRVHLGAESRSPF